MRAELGITPDQVLDRYFAASGVDHTFKPRAGRVKARRVDEARTSVCRIRCKNGSAVSPSQVRERRPCLTH